ncbi:MAG TPA: type II toxin-antitoxin system Phd/YefM family antitoxin [Acidobacteriota bacterium]|nr:type II toxin-antitoxin system Phd/YefM family antitoxin [Acidobacteriota bacterium]
MTTSISALEARDRFADMTNQVHYGKERVVVTRRSKPFVAIVPLDDLKLIELLEDLIDIEEAHRALAEAEAKGTISWEDIKEKLGL